LRSNRRGERTKSVLDVGARRFVDVDKKKSGVAGDEHE